MINMQFNLNLSLILNVIFLIGVTIAIVRTWRARSGSGSSTNQSQSTYSGYDPERSPSLSLGEGAQVKSSYQDEYDDSELIRVSPRRVDVENNFQSSSATAPVDNQNHAQIKKTDSNKDNMDNIDNIDNKNKVNPKHSASETIVVFLLAKEDRQFTGYALLQTLLSAGLRFGEGSLFHRHQSAHGQGPVLFSLASATETGLFDLQNMGACSVKGLCLFMHVSGNESIDQERFALMLEVGQQLTEELDAYMLDDRKQPWSSASTQRYQQKLQQIFVAEEALA